MIKKLNNLGDTIIEVLISVSIVGLVLTGAFNISNQSLKQIQQSQERTEAQKIAASYIESLNKFVKTNPSILTSAPADFCISYPTYAIIQPVTASDCNNDPNGRYHTVIKRSTNPSTPHVFIVNVEWDGLSGRKENVVFSYRVKDPD